MEISILRIVWFALAFGLSLTGCTDSGPAQDNQISVPQKAHVTILDLERLGCRVNADPRISSMDIPLLGRVEGYAISTESSCASILVSTLHRTKEYDPGVWTGLRASASSFARNHGYEQSSFQGEIGEHSEIEVFTKDGKQQGFQYSVQANGYLHSVTLISDSIDPEGDFEAVLKEKL